MQVGGSRLPRPALPRRVAQADPVVIARRETARKEIVPVATAEEAVVAIAAGLAQVAVDRVAAVASAAALAPAVVRVGVHVGVATAMCRAARCAPSASTA